MQVFKCALRLVLRRPVYFLIYGLWLSFMGVFMASSVDLDGAVGEYEPYHPDYAVIDRDGSEVSHGFLDFLATQGARVDVSDTREAIQDAVAKGEAAYLLVIPEGYGARFMEAARAGAQLPEMECIYSYYSSEGALMDEAVSEYASALAGYAEVLPDASVERLAALAQEAAEATAEVRVIPAASGTALTDRFVFYLQFDMYVYFAGIIVCAGLMLVELNRTDVRRRNLASPTSYASYSLQMGLACAVVMLAFCALTVALGIICFPESFAAIPAAGKALMIGISVLFACIPLGVAYLLAQLNVGETLMNACGNILGLVLSFLGGSWVPMELMSSEVDMLAHFLPGYWYTDALARAASFTGDAQALAVIGADAGVIALFAVAAFGIALVVGRTRTQTADAGGNAAAEAPAL